MGNLVNDDDAMQPLHRRSFHRLSLDSPGDTRAHSLTHTTRFGEFLPSRVQWCALFKTHKGETDQDIVFRKLYISWIFTCMNTPGTKLSPNPHTNACFASPTVLIDPLGNAPPTSSPLRLVPGEEQQVVHAVLDFVQPHFTVPFPSDTKVVW